MQTTRTDLGQTATFDPSTEQHSDNELLGRYEGVINEQKLSWTTHLHWRQFHHFLGRIATETLGTIEREVTEEMDAAADEALESRDRIPPPEQALYGEFSEGGVLVGLTDRLVSTDQETERG